jgi:ABC-type multidrug transport system fused ATPase/permease subunit
MVTQEPILFNDTVSQNIHLSRAYSETRIEDVLKTANAYDFIHQRVDGVLYQIGERGNNLSGGERQRMTIARALYNDPPILIFDEATSSLDPNSEEIVKDSLSKALLNRTAIIIAHKLATIKDVDRIIVMDKGKIVEEGSFTKLSQEGNYFKRILDKSFLT